MQTLLLFLVSLVKRADLDPDCLDSWKSWAFMLNYPVKLVEKEGYLHGSGIDSLAFNRATESHKKISYLEETQSVFDAFDQAPKSEHIAQIDKYVKNPESPIEEIVRIISSWENKKSDYFDKLLKDMREIAPISVNLNIDRRNIAWMEQIKESLLKNSKSVFFVGSLHLFGEYGLVSLIRNEGYSCVIK